MEKSDIKIQYDRLKRHYNLCKDGVDEVAFLDMAHSLRIWGEMSSNIDSLINSERPDIKFFNVQKNKKIKDLFKATEFIYLPLGNAPSIESSEVNGVMIFPNKVLSQEEVTAIYNAGPPVTVKTTMKFSEWLAASIFETNGDDGYKVLISRQLLIKRVSNVLGASHPKGKEDKDEYENRFDKYINRLLELKTINGYPIIYYQLLEIAEEIIEKLECLFKMNI